MSKFITEVTINNNTVHHDGNFGKTQIENLGISATSLTGLATVATTGSYNDLTDKPAGGNISLDTLLVLSL
jgi:hypothetical protein